MPHGISHLVPSPGCPLPHNLPHSFFKFIFKFLFYIGVELINNVALVSGVQQSDSLIHTHVSVLFQILFPFSLLQNIVQSSLCSTVGPCWFPILNITVCTRQSQTPHLSTFLNPKNLRCHLDSSLALTHPSLSISSSYWFFQQKASRLFHLSLFPWHPP